MCIFSDNQTEEINRLKTEADDAKNRPYEFKPGVFLLFLSFFALIDQVPLLLINYFQSILKTP